MTTKNMAILTVTPEAFRHLLQLPDDVEVVRVEMAPGQRGTLHVMVEGVGWPTGEGGHVCPTIGVMLDGRIDWGFPESVVVSG